MNKKLVALAIAGAVALPLGAQAQTAQVTLYGRANVDLEFVKGQQPDGSNNTVTRVNSNSSRFGLRGTESLGGGLTAFFQVENSVNWDGNPQLSGAAANAGTIANRETFVGLQGNFGQIWLGRALSPYDDTTVPWAPNVFNYNTGIMATSTMFGNTAQGGGNPVSGSYDDRYSNSIRWNSATMAGFTAEVQYAVLENQKNGYALIPAIFYNNGPIQASAAWAHHDKLRCYAATGLSYASCSNGPSNGSTAGLYAAKDDAYTIAFSYDFRVVRLAAHYEYLKYNTPGGDLTRESYGVTGIIPLGGGNVYLYYGNAGDGKGGASDLTPRINSLAHGDNTSMQMYEIGYSYFLSKRTQVNAGYVNVNNKSRANYTFNVNGYSVATGGDPQGLVFGLIHNF